MSFDAEGYRRTSREAWEAAAAGWVNRQAMMREIGAPVSDWLVQALALQAGERVLELAGGLGETGLLAAELLAPSGTVIISDRAEAMLDGARARAQELGLANVEFQVLDAEWIDLPLASVDAVLCRWGYMLMADPGAALTETRRVLRPGGRVALAVWDTPAENPWFSLPAAELRERGLANAAPGPGPFALADRGALEELLAQAGFTGTRIETVEVLRRHPGFADFWESTLDLSRNFHDAVLGLPEAEIERVRTSLEGRFAPYATDGGALEVPGRTLVATADA